MNIRNLLLIGPAITALVACSGGGGGGGGTTSTAGYLAAPSASCAGSSCIPGARISSGGLYASSVSTDRAVAVYEAVNISFIPKLNTFLAKVYAAMVAGGSQSCNDVTMGSSGTVSGYSFSITSPNTSIPTGFTKAGSSYDYRIYAAVGESPVAEVQVHCGAGTASDPLTIAARVKENGDQYQFVYEKSGNKIRLMGGGILATGGRMVTWFKTDDGNDFDLEVVSNADSTSDHWKARGNKTSDVYNLAETVSSYTGCVNGAGASANCSSYSINASPTLAVTSSNNWSTVTATNFTIANP